MDIFSREMLYAGGGSWVRPNLTNNGVLGGNSFAVDSNSGYGYIAYQAVDSSLSTYLRLAVGNSFTFYNPTPLKVTQLAALYIDISYYGKITSVQGSNSGTSWSTIGVLSRQADERETITLINSNYYKFYKVTFNGNASYVTQIRLADLQITAEEQ